MRRWVGPGILVAVGYMDPGNWATGVEAGSGYGYTLAWVIVASSLAAILLQILAARLGLWGGTDLVGLGYRFFGRRIGGFLAFTAFIAVAATDLAEVLGFALALRLLLGVPMAIGALLALVEVVLVLYWSARRPRLLETLVGILTLAIVAIFLYELVLLRPPLTAVLAGLIPSSQAFEDPQALYLVLGLIGATIMPHNLYLHSSWVAQQHRTSSPAGASAFLTQDTVRSLSLALFVNLALLITAAALRGHPDPVHRWDIAEAYRLFEPAVGAWAGIAFGVALLLSGHNATLTSTLTGQFVLGYLLPRRISPALRAFLLRSASLLPALLVLLLWGESEVGPLLVLSQVVLSLQLPFVLGPMLYFLFRLPEAQTGRLSLSLAYAISLLITGLNLYLIWRL
ncbi:MAG: divalent metal cation transporter MntH 2 [Bacteroidia bacterium]|nr:MAG: divalent metal cation transporter MntH 2 [Bacteroidia bacterium]